jgi:putative hydrolase
MPTAATNVTTSGADSHSAHAMRATVPESARSLPANRRHFMHPRFVGTNVASMSSNLPFGFGSGDRDPNQSDDLSSKIPLFAELQKLMSWTGGPVNWDLARQIAISSVANTNHTPTVDERAHITDAIRLADLWLDDATDLPSGVITIEAWSRIDWIERTLPVWATLCDPVAARVVGAMGSVVPEEVLSQAGPLAGVMNQFGGMMFGAQVGQGLAALAQEIISSTDVGLPLSATGTAALLPENVAAFGAGLERPAEEVLLYLALREAAHHRLYAHVPWLRQRVIDTVDAYARGISVDAGAIERAMGQIDPNDPESMQNALAGGMFEPDQTPEQLIALRRLETLLALVEGWVDAVVQTAAGERMPGAEALREASRRRRATGGPAEQTFSTLVGLELRPRRLREAAALWWAVTQQRGVSGRDAIWAHPDLLPTADDLDDPLGFAERTADDGSDPLAGL